MMPRPEGERLPLPDRAESPEFHEAAKEGRLVVPACGSCGRRRFPPRAACPSCGSFQERWEEIRPVGTIWSFVVAHPPALPAFEPYMPLPIVIVSLNDAAGIRLPGNLVIDADSRIDSVAPGRIDIGASVRAVFVDLGDDVWYPRWALAPTRDQRDGDGLRVG